MLRYGWPGPYPDSISELNAGETIWKVRFWAVVSFIVPGGAAIGAGYAARAAKQRVWLVLLVGLAITTAVVLVVAVLLTPPLASSAG